MNDDNGGDGNGGVALANCVDRFNRLMTLSSEFYLITATHSTESI